MQKREKKRDVTATLFVICECITLVFTYTHTHTHKKNFIFLLNIANRKREERLFFFLL